MLQSYGLSLSVIIGKDEAERLTGEMTKSRSEREGLLVCRIKEFEPPLVIRHNVFMQRFYCHLSLLRLNTLQIRMVRVIIRGDNRVIIEKNNFSIVTLHKRFCLPDSGKTVHLMVCATFIKLFSTLD